MKLSSKQQKALAGVITAFVIGLIGVFLGSGTEESLPPLPTPTQVAPTMTPLPRPTETPIPMQDPCGTDVPLVVINE